MIAQRIRVNCLYCFMVTITLTGVGFIVVQQFVGEDLLSSLLEFDASSSYARLGIGFSPIAVLLLTWRTWMALRYRPCPPCSDDVLPTVTVVIPAYNEGRQVYDTICSVMASDYPSEKIQVFCVDDGSKDDTWQWMRAAAGTFSGRLHLLRQPKNLGKRHALLAGFRQAQGEVFVTIDSDSLILPDTLRHLVSPLATSPHVGAVAGNVRVLNVQEGSIPKMLDVSFTLSFDFLRRGQGVYGGVLCTPGALSAYRSAAIAPVSEEWAGQTFMGNPAGIGEDRALSNIILGQGLRVVYQKDAVVLTTMPTSYRMLSRMFLRWARSNVRECLVMLMFLFRRFRDGDTGAGWVRLSGLMELVLLPMTEILKVGCLFGLFFHPLSAVRALTLGGFVAAALPAVVYQFRRPGLFGIGWAVAYSFFWVSCLSWISMWGLFSAARSGWLTRTLASNSSLSDLTRPKCPNGILSLMPKHNFQKTRLSERTTAVFFDHVSLIGYDDVHPTQSNGGKP